MGCHGLVSLLEIFLRDGLKDIFVILNRTSIPTRYNEGLVAARPKLLMEEFNDFSEDAVLR